MTHEANDAHPGPSPLVRDERECLPSLSLAFRVAWAKWKTSAALPGLPELTDGRLTPNFLVGTTTGVESA